MKFKAPKFLLKMTGDIFLYRYPLFLTYKPHHHKVKGHEVRQILDVTQAGDILLRRYDGYLNTIFTPGFYGHSGLAVAKKLVIHAIGKGVVCEDILDFCRADSVVVLRQSGLTAPAIAKARQLEKERTAYDYEFMSNNRTVYCTEFVDVCYGGLFQDDYEIMAGNRILLPDGIRHSDKVDMIIEFKHYHLFLR